MKRPFDGGGDKFSFAIKLRTSIAMNASHKICVVWSPCKKSSEEMANRKINGGCFVGCPAPPGAGSSIQSTCEFASLNWGFWIHSDSDPLSLQTSFFQSMAVAYTDSLPTLYVVRGRGKPVLRGPSSTEPNLFHHGETTCRVG